MKGRICGVARYSLYPGSSLRLCDLREFSPAEPQRCKAQLSKIRSQKFNGHTDVVRRNVAMRHHPDHFTKADRENAGFFKRSDDLGRGFAGAGNIKNDDIGHDAFDVDRDTREYRLALRQELWRWRGLREDVSAHPRARSVRRPRECRPAASRRRGVFARCVPR